MNKRFVILAIAAIAFAGCSGGGEQQTSASATPSAGPATPQPPNPAEALHVSLTSATIVGTPTPQNMVPVRLLYKVRVDAPNGITAAYGSAALPGSPNCDGGAAVAIQEGPMPHGATVEQQAMFYCAPRSAQGLGEDPSDFYAMDFTPSAVTFPPS